MMPDKTLTFTKDEQSIDDLWSMIESGYSVKSAVYLTARDTFRIKLSTDHWPEIKLPCSECGVKLPPAYLTFKPFNEARLCIVCAR